MKVILRLRELEILYNFFMCLAEMLGASSALRKKIYLMILFSEIMNQILYLKLTLAICKTYQFISYNSVVSYFNFYATLSSG